MFRKKIFSIKKACNSQMFLSKMIIRKDCFQEKIKHVAGVDVAYFKNLSIGAVAVLNYPSMDLKERKTSRHITQISYKPTFLSFRELHPIVSAVKKLSIKPEIFLVDGHGIAHPRHFGLASHLGLVLDFPTIGVAKRLLCGEVKNSNSEGWKPIIYKNEVVGGVIFTRQNTKPIYVSVGHKTSLKSVIKTVLDCATKYRFPEPLREAHITAENEKRVKKN
jgi:deoxyribonuclease V